MNKKMYQIKSWDRVLVDVETVDIIKETERSVWMKSEIGRGLNRELKRNSYHIYVDTLEEVTSVLLERAEYKKGIHIKKVEYSKKQIKKLEAEIEQLKENKKEFDK